MLQDLKAVERPAELATGGQIFAHQFVRRPDRPDRIGAGEGKGFVERTGQRVLSTGYLHARRQDNSVEIDRRGTGPVEAAIVLTPDIGGGHEEQFDVAVEQRRNDQEVGFVAAADDRLSAAQPPAGALGARHGLHRIPQATIAFAVRDSSANLAGRDVGQPRPLLLRSSGRRDDPRGDHRRQIGFQRQSAAHQLGHHGDVGKPSVKPAMRLRQAEREQAEVGKGLPRAVDAASGLGPTDAALVERVTPRQQRFERLTEERTHIGTVVGKGRGVVRQ
jgi:hypothetical protein